MCPQHNISHTRLNVLVIAEAMQTRVTAVGETPESSVLVTEA